MKRLFFVNLLLMAVVSSAMAQQTTEPRNPVRGYVITNDNDTLWGTIDYLTGKENAEACHFQDSGLSTARRWGILCYSYVAYRQRGNFNVCRIYFARRHQPLSL